MAKLRTDETEQHYKDLIATGHLEEACRLCEAASLKEFAHWKIVKNKFPYDRIARTHDMLLPKRHVQEKELSGEELKEYQEIKAEYVEETYEYLLEPTAKLKSIPEHYHIHLIIAKDD